MQHSDPRARYQGDDKYAARERQTERANKTWCEGMRDYDSSAWDLMVIWVTVTITQSFRLHLHDPQLYTGFLDLSSSLREEQRDKSSFEKKDSGHLPSNG